MPGVIEVLERLQEIDTKILGFKKLQDELPRRVSQLKEIVDLEAIDLDKAHAKHKTISDTKKAIDLDLTESHDKLKISEEKLKNITNNTEYQAAVKENNNMKKRIEKLEADALAFMERLDAEQKAIQELQKSYDDHRADYEKQKGEVDAKVAELQSQVDKQEISRKAIAADVPRPMLMRYDRILRGAGGLAVTTVMNGTCQACSRKLLPQKLNMIQKGGEIHQCDHCQRFLVYK